MQSANNHPLRHADEATCYFDYLNRARDLRTQSQSRFLLAALFGFRSALIKLAQAVRIRAWPITRT